MFTSSDAQEGRLWRCCVPEAPSVVLIFLHALPHVEEQLAHGTLLVPQVCNSKVPKIIMN